MGAWEAEVLQSQLSYPMLAYFRSQHTNQSWLATLTTIVDASALVIIGADGNLKRQAELTFAMGRRALVDLATVFATPPRHTRTDRLPSEDFSQLRELIAARTTPLDADQISEARLEKLRRSYEPFANALARYCLIALPPWFPGEPGRDNWQRTSWDHSKPLFAVSDPFMR